MRKLRGTKESETKKDKKKIWENPPLRFRVEKISAKVMMKEDPEAEGKNRNH